MNVIMENFLELVQIEIPLMQENPAMVLLSSLAIDFGPPAKK